MNPSDIDWRPEGTVTCGECAKFIRSPYEPKHGHGQCQSFLDYQSKIRRDHNREVRPKEYESAMRALDRLNKFGYPNVFRYCRKFEKKI